jgi:nitric oxide reductase subunit B
MRSFARPLPNATTDDWFWFGNQGLSYFQLGRIWQIGFFLGLIWSILIFHAL